MRIGITYDLKPDAPAAPGAPDDLHEEFDSPATIEAIAAVLRDLGHDALPLGDGKELLRRLLDDPPDFVFNIAEGQGVGRSREARVPAVLEMLGIPYSGSDPLTLAVTLDKEVAKKLVAADGVRVPNGVVLPPDSSELQIANCKLRIEHWPVIVKQAWEGSSKDVRQSCLVKSPEKLAGVIESVRRDHRQPVLVEEFVQGEEVTVGIIGNDPPQILGMIQVVPTEPTEHFI